MATQLSIDYSILLRIFGKREIEAIEKKRTGQKLKQTEKNYLSRSIRPKLIAAYALANTKLLEEIQRKFAKNDAHILYNLAQYGYPFLLQKEKKAKKLEIEDLIIEILTHYPKARYIEAIPFLLLKNKWSPWKLLEQASKNNCKNKIGYLLQTAELLGNINTEAKELLEYLEKNKETHEAFLVEGEKEFLEKKSPQRIRKWNLLGRFFDEDFKRLAEVYV